MKKRSLFAAVAMLIVSALVLSSATYAWFAASGSVTVQAVSASVSNSNGGILISADNSNWGTNVTKAMLQAQTTNIFPHTGSAAGGDLVEDVLTPVSASVAADSVTFVGGSLQGTSFTASSAAGTEYMYYKVYVKAQADGALTIQPGFSTSCPFIYYHMCVLDSTGSVVNTNQSTPAAIATTLSAAADGYTPVVSSSGSATDDGDCIISASEASAGSVTLGTAVTSAAAAAQTFTTDMTTDQVLTVVIWMWAEGQDAQCKGTVASTAGTSSLVLTYAANS